MAGKKKGRPAKDPFEFVAPEFKDFVNSASDEDVKKKIAEVAMNQAALMEAKEADEDLKEKKAVATEAGRVYTEGTKANKQSIAYARALLGARGSPNGDSSVEKA